ncbi:MAG TPA: hypothetical protein VML54_05990 [Candidatus Limnocylindrales bacterium]|nr:hypothetical protein [Candidatus Limnocylindrales bacterium]
MRRARGLAVLLLGAVAGGEMAGPAGVVRATAEAAEPAAAPAAPDEALDLRRISPEQRRRLLRGEAISYGVAETSEKELTAGLALYLTVPLSRLAEYLSGPEPIAQDPAISTYGFISDAAGPEAFPALRFTRAELAEAQSLLDTVPGTQWNLSRREIDALRALKGSLAGAERRAILAAVSQQHRLQLFERWQAYRSDGLAGIVPYARRNEAVADPAAELRAALADVRPFADIAPRIAEALLRPAGPPASGAPRFYWIRRPLQGRPAVTLVHQVLELLPELILQVERHFYVGHSYNSSQVVPGGFPFQSGLLVVSTNRVTTDHVAGFGNDLTRAVGRRQLRAEVLRRLDRLRAVLVQPARPESP